MASGRTWITKKPDGEVARPQLPDDWLPKRSPALTGELDRSRKPLAQQLSSPHDFLELSIPLFVVSIASNAREMVHR